MNLTPPPKKKSKKKNLLHVTAAVVWKVITLYHRYINLKKNVLHIQQILIKTSLFSLLVSFIHQTLLNLHKTTKPLLQVIIIFIYVDKQKVSVYVILTFSENNKTWQSKIFCLVQGFPSFGFNILLCIPKKKNKSFTHDETSCDYINAYISQ